MKKPYFLITIDTEGDDLWSRPAVAKTRNAEWLPRFQALCEKYRLKPTYLTNHEMALSVPFQEMARDALSRNAAEIGMHLHAWDSPPILPLTADDTRHHPYLIEYPPDVMREKVRRMTDILQSTFGVAVRSHRAGRWAFDETYAAILYQEGYRIDCSVTPHVSWRSFKGAPDGAGGSDYSGFPTASYFMDANDISKPGDSDFLEVPMSISVRSPHLARLARPLMSGSRTGGLVWSKAFLAWLRPTGTNRRSMFAVLRNALESGRDYVEFMLHSSEFMPGGSPKFPDQESIEGLYGDLEALFAHAGENFAGATLGEYYDWRLRLRAAEQSAGTPPASRA